jgi:lysyl-tRNA synthetase class 2
MLATVRAFFSERRVLEVETPALSAAATTDVALASFSVPYEGPGAPPGQRLFLQTSPELAMKRLLAAGSGDIYQVARVFRDGEAGRWHNPEFTLLEWYRVGFDHRQLMDEVQALVERLLPRPLPFSRVGYVDLFLDHLDLDALTADASRLADAACENGIEVTDGLDRDGWLDLLFSHLIAPRLAGQGGVFVVGYPASQAALARLDPDDPRVAERFELYVDGVELANGFHELTDPEEQRKRFERDNHSRRAQGLPSMTIDERLLGAMNHGLPPCAGVALGLDRLLMLATGARRMDEVLAFSVGRA